MSRRAAHEAVVVGAGMVGASMALALARSGFRVALVEGRRPEPWQSAAEVGLRVSALACHARELLDGLGVWQEVAAARVAPYRHMRVWEEGAEIAFDAADIDAPELGHIVENALLLDRLWRALETAPGVELRCPARVVGIRQDALGICLDLDSGDSLRAALAVAADGAASPLRALAGVAVDGRDYAQKGLVLHVETQFPHRHTAWQRFLPGGPLALLPLGDGRCSVVWTLPAAQAERLLEIPDDALSARLTEASEARLGRVVARGARAAFPLRLGLARSYQAGRLVLAGDAAHVVHPLAGQGVNLGFLDVSALCRTLVAARAAGRDPGATDVLRRYARERRSENALAGYGMDALERLFGHPSTTIGVLRRQGLRLVNRLGPFKRMAMRKAAGAR